MAEIRLSNWTAGGRGMTLVGSKRRHHTGVVLSVSLNHVPEDPDDLDDDEDLPTYHLAEGTEGGGIRHGEDVTRKVQGKRVLEVTMSPEQFAGLLMSQSASCTAEVWPLPTSRIVKEKPKPFRSIEQRARDRMEDTWERLAVRCRKLVDDLEGRKAVPRGLVKDARVLLNHLRRNTEYVVERAGREAGAFVEQMADEITGRLNDPGQAGVVRKIVDAQVGDGKLLLEDPEGASE